MNDENTRNGRSPINDSLHTNEYMMLKKDGAFIILLLVVSSILVFSFDVNRAYNLDLGRYYKMIELSQFSSKSEFLLNHLENEMDFIYQLLLFSFATNKLDMNYVTVSFFFLYFLSIYFIVRDNGKNFKLGIVVVYILLSLPTIWILTISRNTAALVFFFLGIHALLFNRKYISFVLFLAAIFTHISMVLYLIMLLMSFVLSKSNFSLRKRNILLIVVLIMSYSFSHLLINLILPYVSLLNFRLSDYANMKIASPLYADNISIHGDKLPMIYAISMLVFLCLKDKRQDWTYWFLYLITLLLLNFIWSSIMMTNRLMMLMPPFLGLSLFAVFYHLKNKTIIYILSYIGILIGLVSFYGYSGMFIF